MIVCPLFLVSFFLYVIHIIALDKPDIEFSEYSGVIFINEVVSKNTTFMDGNGRTPDIIELYNDGDDDIPLFDWFFLSDDNFYFIYDAIIPAKGFLIIYCSSTPTPFLPTETNVSFDIPSSGKKISLFDHIYRPVDEVTVPPLLENESWARTTDGGRGWATKQMTVGRSNLSPNVFIAKPEFSVESGFYNNEFWFELTSEYGHDIYYTLDGSTPTKNSTKYTDPLFVNYIANDKLFIIRAIAADTDGNYSDIVSKTYFVGTQTIYDNYSVISLVINPDDLYDESTGIIANYLNQGQERRASFAFFDENQQLSMQHDVGLRIHGGEFGRRLDIKSFIVRSRSGYHGNDYFDKPFFAENLVRRIVLRYREPVYLDGFLQSLLRDRNTATQKQRLVMVFINGDLYGKHALMERYDADYFSSYYNINSENIVAIKTNYFCFYDFNISIGEENDRKLFKELIDYILHTDFSIESNYSDLLNLIDIKSLVDHYVANIYIVNADAGAFKHNGFIWRARVPEDENYGDGRWRFAMFDLDRALNSYSQYNIYKFNMFLDRADYTAVHQLMYDEILNNLLRNESFKQLFIDTFIDMAENNFAPEIVIPELRGKYGENPLIEEFFSKRKEYALAHLYDYLENHIPQ